MTLKQHIHIYSTMLGQVKTKSSEFRKEWHLPSWSVMFNTFYFV